jgi:hypothetical protein
MMFKRHAALVGDAGTTAPRIVTGPEAAKAAASIAATQDRRDEWPYAWSFPPPRATRVFRVGSVLSPNPATETQVLLYRVPQGYRMWLTAVVMNYQGTGFTPGTGDILWTLDKNKPVGVAPLQGEIIQGFGGIMVPLGSLVYPWPLPMPELLGPTDELRSKVTTTANIPVGGTNYFHSVFLGWLEPETKGR